MMLGMSIRVEDFSAFVVLSKHMNFSKAAVELGITQPTLSKRIAAMERDLGVRLVSRTRPLELTVAGERFLEVAQRIRGVAEKELRGFQAALNDRPAVRLMGFDFISAEGFLASIPDIAVSFVLATGDEGYFSVLREGKADVSATYDVLEVPELAERARALGIDVLSIGRAPGALMVMDRHPLASKGGLARTDLQGVDVAVLGRGPFDEWGRCLSHYLGEGLDIGLVLRSIDGNVHNLERMNLGSGALLMSRMIVDPVLSARSDVRVFYELDGEPIAFPIALLFRRDDPNPNVRVLIERARDYFDPEAMLG